MRPAHAIQSFAAAVIAPRSVQQRQSNAASSAPEGSSGLRGEIVGVNHASKHAFIRTPHYKTDFFVGRRQYHSEMEVGDVVSFECEFALRSHRNHCPEAFSVKPFFRATQQVRSVNPPHVRNGTAGPPAQVVQPQPNDKSFSKAQRSELTEIIRDLMSRHVTGTAGPRV